LKKPQNGLLNAMAVDAPANPSGRGVVVLQAVAVCLQVQSAAPAPLGVRFLNFRGNLRITSLFWIKSGDTEYLYHRTPKRGGISIQPIKP